MLLQRCPSSLEPKLASSFQTVQAPGRVSGRVFAEPFFFYGQVLRIPGVIGFSEPHFWEHSPDKYVGTLRVQVGTATRADKPNQKKGKLTSVAQDQSSQSLSMSRIFTAIRNRRQTSAIISSQLRSLR